MSPAAAASPAPASLDLPGLEASNPLGFLAALGTLRLLERPGEPARLGWARAHGGWTARLQPARPSSASELAAELAAALNASSEHPALGRWGDLPADPGAAAIYGARGRLEPGATQDDLSVHPDEFGEFACRAAAAAWSGDPTAADFAAAFGCEATPDPGGAKLTIQDTALRTMSGAGHQHFLKTMRHVLAAVTAEHVEKALFTPWTYDDPVEKSTLRWDPQDDVRYALRWRNPSGDPERKKQGTVLGANALAVHALPLLPTAPRGRRLATTGFAVRDRRDEWTWPVWEPPLPLPVVRSLLALADLQQAEPPRDDLARRGIAEVYRSRRITTGKFRNFTPAEPV